MNAKITTYRNPTTGETCPAHEIGTDENGDRLYDVPEGWEPVEPFWLDEDGHAHAGEPDDRSAPRCNCTSSP